MIDRAEKMARRARRKMTQLVEYARGNDVFPCAAVQAETRAQADDGETLVYSQIVDWLLEAIEIPFQPEKGDKITDQRGRVFEVLPIADERSWRWHGRNGLTYRIHTKQVAE